MDVDNQRTEFTDKLHNELNKYTPTINTADFINEDDGDDIDG